MNVIIIMLAIAVLTYVAIELIKAVFGSYHENDYPYEDETHFHVSQMEHREKSYPEPKNDN